MLERATRCVDKCVSRSAEVSWAKKSIPSRIACHAIANFRSSKRSFAVYASERDREEGGREAGSKETRSVKKGKETRGEHDCEQGQGLIQTQD